MPDAVIAAALRTPIGRYRGGLSHVRPDDLLALVIGKLLERAGVEPAAVDEVYAGCANQAGEDNRNVARMAWLAAGSPYEVPALTLNRPCASGLEAVIQGARAIWAGESTLVVAGGVESMTRAPLVAGKGAEGFAGGNRTMYDTSLGWRFPNPRHEARFPLEGMGETAENLAERFTSGREPQDAFALQSHQRAIAAWEAGRFADEVVAVPGADGKTAVARDEGPRADTSLDKLKKLKLI